MKYVIKVIGVAITKNNNNTNTISKQKGCTPENTFDTVADPSRGRGSKD